MNVIDRMEKVLVDQGVPPRGVRRRISTDCGCTYEAVRQWFAKPTTKIEAEHLLNFSEKNKVNMRWLLTGKGSRSRDPELTPRQEEAVRLMQVAGSEFEESILDVIRVFASRKETSADEKTPKSR